MRVEATLVVIKSQTDSWWWPAFTFAYMTALAYAGARDVSGGNAAFITGNKMTISVTADQIVTLAIVALAVGYLLRRTWGVLASKRQSGCGACGSCPAQAAGTSTEPQVLSVESLLEPRQ